MVEVVNRDTLSGYDAPGIVVRDHFRFRPGAPGLVAGGLGPVVVLAETTLAEGAGFPMHAHQGVEILSYICTGRLTHADTMGNGASLDAGDVQVMRCGTGVCHSEVNGGQSAVRIYQLWLAARRPMVAPGYVDLTAPLNRVGEPPVVLASGRDGETGRVAIDVDALILGGVFEPGGKIERDVEAGRAVYVVAAEGSVSLDIHNLEEGDAGLCREPGTLAITACSAARILVLDVAL